MQKSFSWVLFGGLAALNKEATTSLNKDKALRAHKGRLFWPTGSLVPDRAARFARIRHLRERRIGHLSAANGRLGLNSYPSGMKEAVWRKITPPPPPAEMITKIIR